MGFDHLLEGGLELGWAGEWEGFGAWKQEWGIEASEWSEVDDAELLQVKNGRWCTDQFTTCTEWSVTFSNVRSDCDHSIAVDDTDYPKEWELAQGPVQSCFGKANECHQTMPPNMGTRRYVELF